MTTILSKIIKINDLQVVGVLNKGGEEQYHVITFKKKGSEIKIVSTSFHKYFNDLTDALDLNLPIILSFDGKGVLNRAINFNVEQDVLWYKNIDFNTIFYTDFKGVDKSFISFCRKNIVEQIIERFEKVGCQIVDVYLGSFVAALLANTLNQNRLVSNDLILELNQNKLIGFTRQVDDNSTEKYVIGTDIISKEQINLYACLVHFYTKSEEVSKTNITALSSEEILYKKGFKVLGIGMLVAFFSTLLLSFIIMQIYASRNSELAIKNAYSNKSYQQILNLENQKENKLKILKESGLWSSKFFSFYSYELIKIVPPDLSLSALELNPLSEEVKANKKLLFYAYTISVKGETWNESSFSTWLENLKKLDWMENFEIISLKKNKKNKSQFEVKITVKNV